MPLTVLLRRDIVDDPGHPITLVCVFEARVVAESTARALLAGMLHVAALARVQDMPTPLERLLSQQPLPCDSSERAEA